MRSTAGLSVEQLLAPRCGCRSGKLYWRDQTPVRPGVGSSTAPRVRFTFLTAYQLHEPVSPKTIYRPDPSRANV